LSLLYYLHHLTVEIIAQWVSTLSEPHMKAPERSPYYEFSFISANIPHAIEVEFSHNPDLYNGGIGKIYVANPGGDLKSLFWSDN